ncbi:hypothetical protein [Sphingomonas sp.]|uniref:hypothetical protein n=1 Tax=Sphingomonas sp. TaxID=28214 RepID=UPI001D793292|nr:hypothetical protein [Sphingomonas sp.]MBX9797598.1 hypothetical protein [Sphingomonas sp.]
MSREPQRSMLHMQMGQETIYLLLAITLFSTVVMGAYLIALNNAPKPREEPPIIVLPEAEGFSFAAGSATLGPEFEARLTRQVIPRLRATARAYDARVIEVIGHTDDVPRQGGGRLPSDLDRTLVPYFLGQTDDAPDAADNAGLGMARAVSVARYLRLAGLQDFTIVPLSAGPFLKPDDSVVAGGDAVADDSRRRIEVRLRRKRVASQPAGSRP